MSRKSTHYLSLIIPTYKRSRGIFFDLKRIKKVLDTLPYAYEIICVVDGSVDDTGKHAQKFAAHFKNIKVLTYEINQGKGYAVRTGMKHAHGDLIGFIDSGNDIHPKNLKNVVDLLISKDADIIVGSKTHPKSKVTYSWQRRLLSMGYRSLISSLFNLNIKETQVGIKVYKRQVLDKILPALDIKRFAFDIEMLSVAYAHGFTKIYEAPVEVKLEFNANSTIIRKSLFKEVSKMVTDTLLVFYRMKTGYYYSQNKSFAHYSQNKSFAHYSQNKSLPHSEAKVGQVQLAPEF